MSHAGAARRARGFTAEEPTLINTIDGVRRAAGEGLRQARSGLAAALASVRVDPRQVLVGSLAGLALVLIVAGGFAMRGVVALQAEHAHGRALSRAAAGGVSDSRLQALMRDAGPGALRIAAFHDPDNLSRFSVRPPGWERLDIDTPPSLGLGRLDPADAQKINALIPFAALDTPPARPFVLKGPERTPAVQCLTTAIYYEAALEPTEGQEAVAQVVLNRVRHADYPKSVCGVVFQGAERAGCQFSFACDGSMARPPAAWAWKRAKAIAEQALDGFVMSKVGTATHYHTDWIVARWTPTLVKIGQFGQHLFFRPAGPDGMLGAFQLAYRGGEAHASRVDLIGKPQVIATPDVLLVSNPDGTPFTGGNVVRGERTLVLPGSTIVLGRVHGIITEDGQLHAQAPTMHAMIAMRAAAARAVKAAEREQAALAAQQKTEAQGAAAPASPPAAG